MSRGFFEKWSASREVKKRLSERGYARLQPLHLSEEGEAICLVIDRLREDYKKEMKAMQKKMAKVYGDDRGW